MIINKVVVHDKMGRVIKGTTADFLPKKPFFHLARLGAEGEQIQKILVQDLKAVFFVKDFAGNRNYKETKSLEALPASGKKIRATFKDGEVIVGYTHALHLGEQGFFLIPADPKGNNERIFVVLSSLRGLEVDGSPVPLP